jgi:hypothetical protein
MAWPLGADLLLHGGDEYKDEDFITMVATCPARVLDTQRQFDDITDTFMDLGFRAARTVFQPASTFNRMIAGDLAKKLQVFAKDVSALAKLLSQFMLGNRAFQEEKEKRKQRAAAASVAAVQPVSPLQSSKPAVLSSTCLIKSVTSALGEPIPFSIYVVLCFCICWEVTFVVGQVLQTVSQCSVCAYYFDCRFAPCDRVDFQQRHLPINMASHGRRPLGMRLTGDRCTDDWRRRGS